MTLEARHLEVATAIEKYHEILKDLSEKRLAILREEMTAWRDLQEVIDEDRRVYKNPRLVFPCCGHG
jgi:hypothetical protein